MDDDQKDITEEQRLQQAQSAGTSPTTPAGGQASFSADYSAAQQVQDSGATGLANEDTLAEEGSLINDNDESVDNSPTEISAELSEEDDSAAVMNDYVEDDFEENIDDGEEETGEEETNEPEESDESDEPGEEEAEESSEQGEPSGEAPAQSVPGSVVGPDGQIGVVADGSEANSDQQDVSNDSTDTDTETDDIPAPDLTPETDSTSVDQAIDEAFADYNDGNDAGASDVLGGGAND